MITSNTSKEANLGLIESLLQEQHELTAVERFSQVHETMESPAGEKYYRDLIPIRPPGAGEQYSFEVDLDACSGCQACVAACHNLNGLEENELWRKVGQLIGGSKELPILQHVTTACHHCVEPACMHGCPVEAYEKDPLTGIVRHLDDQCIGCQYCTLQCPYDVPVYSHSKGIVRKCDMCHQRLAVGEAPACVQACPNQAIRIRTINQQTVREESELDPFLPGAPDPAKTIPTTYYKTERVMPRNVVPADYFSVQQQHGHLPLVIMLVLTQMSVGAFVVEYVLHWAIGNAEGRVISELHPFHLVSALGLGMLGLGAAIFHLGRPFYAYRAMLGLRTSWLSREILAFNLFAGIATTYVAASALPFINIEVSPKLLQILAVGACLSGIGAVLCSVMIYVDCRRPLWTFERTTGVFLMTGLVLGIPTSLVVAAVAATFSGNVDIETMMNEFGDTLCQMAVLATGIKLLLELSIFKHVFDWQYTPRRRTALLLQGELFRTTTIRFLLGLVGGIFLPLLMLLAMPPQYQAGLVIGGGLLSLLLLTTGELLERYLFFVASVSPRMPGKPAQ